MLKRKAFRSIWMNKKSYLSCIVLISIGIMVYVSFNILFVNISMAKDNYYESQNFADVFAAVSDMEQNQADSFHKIEGIRQVSGRLVTDAAVELEGVSRTMVLELLSYDPEETLPVSHFLIEEGKEAGSGLILGADFMDAHGLQAGDQLTLITGGKEYQLPVAAAAVSPEYIYAIRDISEFMPDPEAFSFAYLPYDQLAQMLGSPGRINSLSFVLEAGYDFDDVKIQLEDALSGYGLISLYDREDQVSHSMLQSEIEQLSSMASSIPFIFIGMAVILLYIMLKRIIEQERSQIGTLKAFGYSDAKILLHYLIYGTAVGLIGGIIGGFGGIVLVDQITEMYLTFFQLPAFTGSIDLGYLLYGVLISLFCGVAGAFMGARSMLKLNPVDAMRPAAPKPVKKGSLLNFRVFRFFLASHGRMALRGISRARFRSLFVVLGISFAFALTAFLASFRSMMDVVLMTQYTKIQLYDVKISLYLPRAYSQALEEVWALEEVRQAEGILEVPAVIHNGHRNTSLTVTGLEADSALYQVYDSEKDTSIPLTDKGLVLTDNAARELEAVPGDLLYLETAYSDEKTPVRLAGTVSQNLGSACYIQLETLAELLDIPPVVTGIILDSGEGEQIRDYFKNADHVISVSTSREAVEKYQNLMESYVLLIDLMQLLGTVIAFAIIYNTSAISLSERKREYATLQVMGMQPNEVGSILGFEYCVLTLTGILAGMPLTTLIKQLVNMMMDVNMFSLPTDTPPSSYLIAAAGCLAAVLLSNFSAVKQITGLDMVDVLKERE